MAVTITATVGSASANSFASEAEAAAYLNTRLNIAPWVTITGALTDSEKRAMIEAARELNLLRWTGTRVDSTQAMSWPRQYAVNPDVPYPVDIADTLGWPVYFASTVVPTRIKNAQIELALEFIKAGTTDLAAADAGAFVIREKVDVLETEYAAPYMRPSGLARFPRVMLWIADLLDTASTGGLELVRM